MDEIGNCGYTTQHSAQKRYVESFILMLQIMVLVTKHFTKPAYNVQCWHLLGYY